ncbi:co-chaperone GroES family protein [soil metagenome]|jgi:co-chaperonin GroES (HSP10)
MRVSETNKLEKIIVVGDRVLIKPKTASDQTKSGLFLPPGVQEKERVQEGYIMRVGPGYPLPPDYGFEEDPALGSDEEEVRYIPLQAREGDLAIYLQRDAIEINYLGQKYFIVPQSAVLMLIREEDLGQ